MRYANTKQWIIGIDEAGRGPLAGPVAIGLVAIPSKKMKSVRLMGHIKDSKKLTERQREDIFQNLKNKKDFTWKVTKVSARVIDRVGISKAIKLGIRRLLKDFPSESTLLLDGLLKAPKRFEDQTTIIKGDEKESLIALASIAAKVSRDRYMLGAAKKFPGYEFERHKGYGTTLHLECVEKRGLSLIHRKSFKIGQKSL